MSQCNTSFRVEPLVPKSTLLACSIIFEPGHVFAHLLSSLLALFVLIWKSFPLFAAAGHNSYIPYATIYTFFSHLILGPPQNLTLYMMKHATSGTFDTVPFFCQFLQAALCLCTMTRAFEFAINSDYRLRLNEKDCKYRLLSRMTAL